MLLGRDWHWCLTRRIEVDEFLRGLVAGRCRQSTIAIQKYIRNVAEFRPRLDHVTLRPKFRPFGVVWHSQGSQMLRNTSRRPDLVFGIKIVLHIVDWDLYQLGRWPWPHETLGACPVSKLTTVENWQAGIDQLLSQSETVWPKWQQRNANTIFQKISDFSTQTLPENGFRSDTKVHHQTAKQWQETHPTKWATCSPTRSEAAVTAIGQWGMPSKSRTLCLSARLCPWCSKFGGHRFRGTFEINHQEMRGMLLQGGLAVARMYWCKKMQTVCECARKRHDPYIVYTCTSLQTIQHKHA